MNPKLVAAVLVGGTFVLGGGSALLAELPSPAQSLATEAAGPAPTMSVRRSTSPATLPPAPPTAPAVTAPKAMRVAPISKTPHPSPVTRQAKVRAKAPKGVPHVVIVTTVTYRVRSGDTPSSVARWFERQGYGAEYAAHRGAIDGLSHLVPGELISIVNGKLTVQPLR